MHAFETRGTASHYNLITAQRTSTLLYKRPIALGPAAAGRPLFPPAIDFRAATERKAGRSVRDRQERPDRQAARNAYSPKKGKAASVCAARGSEYTCCRRGTPFRQRAGFVSGARSASLLGFFSSSWLNDGWARMGSFRIQLEVTQRGDGGG